MKRSDKLKAQLFDHLQATKGDETERQTAILDRYRQDIAAAEKAEATALEKLADEAPATPETAELGGLYAGYRISQVFKSLNAGKLPDGMERELNAELNLDGNEIPMKVFEPAADRQKAVTGAPGTVGVNLAPVVPFVFSPSIASTLNISMPAVPSGTYGVPVITTALSAGARTSGTDQAATAASFTVHTMTPKTVSARLEILIEAIAAAGVQIEGPLRQNLSMALSAELDNQIINGDGTGANLSGMFTALDNPAADGTTLTFDHGLDKLSGLIDGLWARETMDIVQVVGVDTYKLAAKSVSVPAAGGKGELTLADYLKAHSGGFTTNSRMPATATNKQQAIACLKGVMGVETAVIPSWGRIQIDDMYSNSAKGQRNVTIHALVGDLKILQSGAYKQVEYKVS